MRRRSRLPLAAFALVCALLSWRAAHAEPAPSRHRLSVTGWSSLGVGAWTVGLELGGSHRVASAGGVPIWLAYGVDTAWQNVFCDSGDSCDSREHRAFAGVGSLWCTDEERAGGFCLGASAGLAYRYVKEVSDYAPPAEEDVVGELRGYFEAGDTARFRLGLRLENDAPSYGDLCTFSDCSIRPVVDLGIITAW